MLENSTDDFRIFDAGDDLHRPTALLAAIDLDTEDAFESLRPTHRRVPRHRPALPFARNPTAAALARHDQSPESMIRGKHAVVARQVHSRARHQRGQAGQKIQRLEDYVCSTVAVRCLQSVPNLPLRRRFRTMSSRLRALLASLLLPDYAENGSVIFM
jgi:hypothetical protein